MKRAKILILNLNPSDCFGDDLRAIVESQFDVEEVKIWDEVGPDSAATGSVKKLAAIIHAVDASVIFVLQAADRLNHTRHLFQSPEFTIPSIPLLVVVDEAEPDEMIEWIRHLAADFLTKPLKAIDVLPRVWRLLDQPSESETELKRVKEELGMKQLVGESEAFLTEIGKLPLIAKCDATVLLTGDTGTGKELCARAIHYLSSRASQSFLPVNCGAIPADLIENELFGHVSGAFTSAKTMQRGLIDEANGGTLFLDEVDCLPLMAQVKLLRFLQEKEYRPLGASKTSKADVRVIAATNINCESAVCEGKLRQDLYYRLNVIQLKLPALHDRREDIPLLAHHFLHRYALEFNKQVSGFSPDALQKLILYGWPGNVRELEHVIMRAIVLSTKPIICAAEIAISDSTTLPFPESFQEAKHRLVDQFEKTFIEGLLLSNHCNISRSAKAAQKNRRAFWELIRKHHISVQTLKSKAS